MPRTSLTVLIVSLALAVVAGCDNGNDTTDSGPGVTDAGSDSGLAVDSGVRPDSGPPGDDCASDDATSNIGCNGFIASEPAANEDFGSCTPGSDTEPAGSCTTAEFCYAGENAPSGWCHPLCTETDTYVSTGTCPAGSRCFSLDGYALCFRDCDTTHPCPTGSTCDGEGSCIPDDLAPPDGGMPDGGVIDTDAGVPDAAVDTDGGLLPDAAIDLDAGLPDAGL